MLTDPTNIARAEGVITTGAQVGNWNPSGFLLLVDRLDQILDVLEALVPDDDDDDKTPSA